MLDVGAYNGLSVEITCMRLFLPLLKVVHIYIYMRENILKHYTETTSRKASLSVKFNHKIMEGLLAMGSHPSQFEPLALYGVAMKRSY